MYIDMKRLKILVLAAIGWLCSMSVSAQKFKVDGIDYYITSESEKTVGVTRIRTSGNAVKSSNTIYSGAVTIPKSVPYEGNTYRVTSIGNCAFEYCSGLTSVEIPNSVTSIGGQAFMGCSGLTSIKIGKGVTIIGVMAFRDCDKLTSVYIEDIAAWCNIEFKEYDATPFYFANELYVKGKKVTDLVIPNGVTSIGNCAFAYCQGLTSVKIPNSVTSIGNRAFLACGGLTSVEMEKGVKSIGWSAFNGCYNMTSVEISNSVTSIGGYAFEGCISLTSLELPNSVTSIGEYAFEYCCGLTSLVIPNSVTSIGDYVFMNCYGLTSLEIPNSVTNIGENAFARCSGLTSLEIPDGVTSIGKNAFWDCSDLTSIEIGKNVTSIGDRAFQGCTSVQNVYMASHIPIPANKNIFSSQTYETATLHVPLGCQSVYKATSPWSEFSYSLEHYFTDINDVRTDKKGTDVFYDLNGRVVKNPTKGVYIVNGKKVLGASKK